MDRRLIVRNFSLWYSERPEDTTKNSLTNQPGSEFVSFLAVQFTNRLTTIGKKSSTAGSRGTRNAYNRVTWTWPFDCTLLLWVEFLRARGLYTFLGDLI